MLVMLNVFNKMAKLKKHGINNEVVVSTFDSMGVSRYSGFLTQAKDRYLEDR